MDMAVLASGYGSNLQAIVNAVQNGGISGRVAVVISDRKGAYALQRARDSGIEALFIDPREHERRDAYDKAILEILHNRRIHLVILAGFMRLLTASFVQEFKSRIMNIHPSLLPAFPGLDGVKQALAYGVKVSGCTVHFVDEGLDTGPIILQEAVPVCDKDTEESLHARIHKVEHRLYPRAIQLFIEGKLHLEGRRCLADEN
ncbi:MAG TPA: phosphoribosylglycinamide formyltransferase [Firmicutes bacterium]|nr:phosphoribosylglycinamide formyltransferase [Bacillota bacterium]